MKLVGYSYPWDVTEPGFAERARGLELDQVAVAVSYHSTRAATPWSTSRTSVLAPHAALHRPVRPDAWRGSDLVPGVPGWLDDPDSAGTAVSVLRAAGIAPAAWVVLAHDSRLGTTRPDLTVQNCFGEHYPWALCPSQPEVREYAATLTREALRDLDVDSVILESCGQMGVVHQSRHEKTDAVWSPALVQLLSVCCCPACSSHWTSDPDAVRTSLADEARRLLSLPEPEPVDLSPDLLTELISVRHRSTDLMRTGVLAGIDDSLPITLHGSPEPWATGALPGLTPAAAGEVGSVVVPCWVPGPASVATVERTVAAVPAEVGVGSYVTAVGASRVADIGDYVHQLAGAGASELHLYHLGLAAPARWPDLQEAATAARTH